MTPARLIHIRYRSHNQSTSDVIGTIITATTIIIVSSSSSRVSVGRRLVMVRRHVRLALHCTALYWPDGCCCCCCWQINNDAAVAGRQTDSSAAALLPAAAASNY